MSCATGARVAFVATLVCALASGACAPGAPGARTEDDAGASTGVSGSADAGSAADPARPPSIDSSREQAGRPAAAPPPADAGAPVRDRGLPRAAADTLRGIVGITGSEPMTTVVVTPREGDAVIVQGATVATLRYADGLEVRLDGRRTAARAVGAGAGPSPVFEARSFVVRALDGEPAMDGILERAPNGFALRTADGRSRAIAALPDGLRDHVGARVYLVGPPTAAPSSYGVLAPRR